MFGKQRLITIAMTVAVITAANRIEPVRDFIRGESNFL
jgi:hypothetical protein